MGDVVYYAVVAVLNLSAVVLYAITSFGNGIVYNSGWQLCYRLDSSVCSGNLAEAVVHVSVATVLLVPMQAYILREHINWKLVAHLALTQQIGIYLGMRILFQFTSVWLQRSMGAVFLIVTLLKISAEVRPSTAPLHDTLPSKYTFQHPREYAIIWFTGFASGVFAGLFAASGPPLMLLVAHINLPKDECRASIFALNLIQNITRVVIILFFQSTVDVYSSHFATVAVVLTLSSIVGMSSGNIISAHINQAVFRRCMLALLSVGSLLLLSHETSTFMTVSLLIGYIIVVIVVALAARALYEPPSHIINLDSTSLDIELPSTSSSNSSMYARVPTVEDVDDDRAV